MSFPARGPTGLRCAGLSQVSGGSAGTLLVHKVSHHRSVTDTSLTCLTGEPLTHTGPSRVARDGRYEYEIFGNISEFSRHFLNQTRREVNLDSPTCQ